MGPGAGSEAHGTARERHVREIAGLLGVADFVFAAPEPDPISWTLS